MLPRLLLVGVLALISACASRTSGPETAFDPPARVPIMGPSRVSAARLATWFNSRAPTPAGVYRATVPIEEMAAYFIEEGAAEGVAGDIAFIQSIVETGWFRFGGSVPASANNFAGIGALDSNAGRFAVFADARTGVRAQIQHLRAYADPRAFTCTVPPLHRPCVDPRFHLVSPKGRAPAWNQLGNGNWATASGYGSRILALYVEALRARDKRHARSTSHIARDKQH